MKNEEKETEEIIETTEAETEEKEANAMTVSYFGPALLPETLLERLGEQREIEGALGRFEKKIADYVGAPYALGLSSSTSALHLAMCALDLKRGDKVLCPVNAFVDVPEVVRHFDAEPIFVDCDAHSYLIDLDRLEEALERYNHKKLRAVIVHHMAGLPVDLERLWELARRYDVKIIEDATHALGATYDARRIGSFPENLLTVFSLGDKCGTHFNAGILVTHDEECHERAALLRNHGMVEQAGGVDYLYDVVDIGCEYRLNDYEALYAEILLEGNEAKRARRREIAEYYFLELAGLNHVRLPAGHPEHDYTRFIVEVDRNRDAFARALQRRGIEINLHYVPLHATRYYKEKYHYKLFDFPQAMQAYQRVMSLPNRPEMSEEELAYVCEAIREIDAVHV